MIFGRNARILVLVVRNTSDNHAKRDFANRTLTGDYTINYSPRWIGQGIIGVEGIWTKPLVRRTLPRVRGSAVVRD